MAKSGPDPNKLYMAIETFQTASGGMANANTTLLWGDDPLVRSHPQFFIESPVHSRPDVEAATEEPGEKRGTSAQK